MDERLIWFRVEHAGDVLTTVSGVSQSESLDADTYVAEFELTARPTPKPVSGDAIEISQVDRFALTTLPQFGGEVLETDAESVPTRFIVRAQGPLALTNSVRDTADFELTGMTDGEIVQEVLQTCGVAFDPADILDCGYVVGERAPVYWRRDQSGASIIQEVDRVFGTKTMEIGFGRVIRIALELAPNIADADFHYERGDSRTLFGARRRAAPKDEQQSYWVVTGPSVDCEDSCTCTVWARAAGTTPRVSSNVRRQPEQQFQSDLIQDEALAEVIVRREMRWKNRNTNYLTLEVLNDPNVHPGTIIGYTDAAYGIDHGTEAPYVVVTVDRQSELMTLSCIGGGEGDEGTVTTGVEKRCNQTSVPDDWPGDYTPPAPTFPPITPPDPWTPDFDFVGPQDWNIFGGVPYVPPVDPDPPPPEEPPDPTCLGEGEADAGWFPDSPGDEWTVDGNSLEGDPGSNALAYSSNRVPHLAGVPLSFRVSFFAAVIGDGGIELYATDQTDEAGPVLWVFHYFPAAWALPAGITLQDACEWAGGCDPGDGGIVDWGDATAGISVPVVIEWDRAAETLTGTVAGVPEVITAAGHNTTAGIRLVAIARAITTGAAELLDVVFEVLEDPEALEAVCDEDTCTPLTFAWDVITPHTIPGSCTIVTSGAEVKNIEMELDASSLGILCSVDSVAATGIIATADGPPNLQIDFDLTLGSDEVDAEILLQDESTGYVSALFTGQSNIAVGPSGGANAHNVRFEGTAFGSNVADAALNAMSALSPIHVTLIMRALDPLLSWTFTQGANTYTFTNTNASNWQHAGAAGEEWTIRVRLQSNDDSSAAGADRLGHFDNWVVCLEP